MFNHKNTCKNKGELDYSYKIPQSEIKIPKYEFPESYINNILWVLI